MTATAPFKMAGEQKSSFLHCLVLHMVWLMLSTIHPCMKNPLYDMTFATGLLPLFIALVPSTIAQLKLVILRSNKRLGRRFLQKIWAIYLVILEKRGCHPKIYIGSGTSLGGGTWNCLRHYETGEMLCRLVRKALSDGYEVTHKGCLCWEVCWGGG